MDNQVNLNDSTMSQENNSTLKGTDANNNEHNPQTPKNRKNKRQRHNNPNNNNNNNVDEKISRTLTWALRHHGPEIGLSMTADGYVPVVEILNCTHPKMISTKQKWTLEDIQNAVKNCQKQRFQLGWQPAQQYPKAFTLLSSSNNTNDNQDDSLLLDTTTNTLLCIRATQGHSLSFINSELLLVPLSNEEVASLPMIVHGTYRQNWQSAICRQGLNHMKRNHIHFTSGLPHEKGDVISGMRTSCDVYIFVDAIKCSTDPSITFYKSANGVLLTAGVNGEGTLPVEYFSHVTDREGNVLLDQRGDGDTCVIDTAGLKNKDDNEK